MNELINRLNEETQFIVDCDEPMDDASWGMEYGVLLTGNEARELLADIEVCNARLDEAHSALSAIYDSGIDLQEHETIIKTALGLLPT